MSTISGNKTHSVNMRTTRIGHTCNFTWTVKNISQIGSAERKFHSKFKLHPTCNVKWELYALYAFPNELVVGYQPHETPCPKIGPGSTIGIYNTSDEIYGSKSFDWANPLREDLSVMFKKPEAEDEPITTEDGKTFEIFDDILVIKGSVVVSDCCSRTELYKPESSGEGFFSLLCSGINYPAK